MSLWLPIPIHLHSILQAALKVERESHNKLQGRQSTIRSLSDSYCESKEKVISKNIALLSVLGMLQINMKNLLHRSHSSCAKNR